MAVQENFQPTYSEKISRAMKTYHAVMRIPFNPTEANPGEILFVSVPKLGKDEVLVPGSLALRFDIDLSGGHANNFLVQNVMRALVDKMSVTFGTTVLEQNNAYGIYKLFEDLFLSKEKRDDMILQGIQSVELCKIRSGAGDKKTSGVNAENKLNNIFGAKYQINLDHQILTDHGIFYPRALYENLTFEITLAEAEHVVRGSDATKLKYQLKNIQLQYEMIRNKTLADEAERVFNTGKEFFYDHVVRNEVVPNIDKSSATRINIKLNPQRRSLKAVLLLFIEGYTGGARDSEKFVFPDLTKVSVTINGSPEMLYNKGIQDKDIWEVARRFFMKEKTENMNLTKFYTADKFGLVIDMRCMPSQAMHGSGTRLVNSTDGVQLEIERSAKDSGLINCHVFTISDFQFNILERQLHSVQY